MEGHRVAAVVDLHRPRCVALLTSCRRLVVAFERPPPRQASVITFLAYRHPPVSPVGFRIKAFPLVEMSALETEASDNCWLGLE